MRRDVGARRQPEHQQRVRLVLGDELGQIAIDGGIAGRKDVRDDLNIASAGRRSRASRSTSGPVGLNGAPGNGPKPVTRMVRRHLHAQQLRDLFDGERRRQLAGGDLRLPPCSSLARTAGSLRNRAVRRSSSMVHIHFTCWSRRRAASSPDAVIFSLCASTCAHNSAMPLPVSAE